MDALIAAAKAEGGLTTIALPHSWCNYGEILSGFTAKYGIPINELNPDAGSGEEIEAIEANKDNPGPHSPDVIDVGLASAPQAKTDGLIQPYKVATWDTIPDAAKDAEGFWYGDYYGVLAFEVNTAVVKNVPADWADLLKPEYKGQVALAGDPTVSNQAISGVWAAGPRQRRLARLRAAGLDFFKQLNDAGNFVPVIAKRRPSPPGETPIRIALDIQRPRRQGHARGNPPIEVVGPDVRPLRRHVRPGDQRVRAASQRREAVDGVPVLRRRPEHLAEGLLQPDPLRRPRRAERRPGRPGAKLPDSPARSCRRSTRSRPPRPLITAGLGHRRRSRRPVATSTDAPRPRISGVCPR